MKKLITLLLVFGLTINPAFCYAGVWKLIVGLGLVGAGTFMTADGFSTEKKVDRRWIEKWDFLGYEFPTEWYSGREPKSLEEYYCDDSYYDDSDSGTVWDPRSKDYWVGDYWYFDYKETKSVLEGTIGIAAIVGGGYSIVDYLLGQSKLKEKAGIEAKIVYKGNTSYLLCSKKF